MRHRNYAKTWIGVRERSLAEAILTKEEEDSTQATFRTWLKFSWGALFPNDDVCYNGNAFIKKAMVETGLSRQVVVKSLNNFGLGEKTNTRERWLYTPVESWIED